MRTMIWRGLLGFVAPQHLRLGSGIFGIGVGITAYTLGMRHAFDADHIGAIDNTTRKLMSEGQRPLSVGFFFSLGHSTIVFVLAELFAVGILGLSGIAFTRIGVVMALLFVTLPFVVRTVQPVLIELDRETEEASHSLGASPFTTFRRVVFPVIFPAILSGVALAYARAVGEFGAVVLITGNLPFKTEVASVFIRGQIESDNVTAAAAVSTVLLVVALIALVSLDTLQRWGSRRG